MIKKWNENVIVFCVVLIIIFIIMLVFNKYTYYVADDFSYMNSFDGTGRIKNVFDIFPSMYAHAFSMNGRLVAHFFVQLFLIFPPFVFDFVNAGMFLLLVLILYKYCFWEKQVNVLIVLGIFSTIWYFVPAFGQTMLWTDGSCNYLWGIVVVMGYLYPYVALTKQKIVMKNSVQKIFYVAAGVLVGDYLETASLGAIFISMMCLGLYKITMRKKIPLWAIGGWIGMGVGFLLMMIAPGTLKNKVATLEIKTYGENFLNALDMYKRYLLWLFLLYLAFFVVAIMNNYRDNLAVSFFFFTASMLTNFMHCVATYYPERNMLSSTIFLIVAILLLVKEIYDKVYGIFVTCLVWVILVFASGQFFYGGYDIYETYNQCMQREYLVEEAKEMGETELALPVIVASTKYSAHYGVSDLNIENNHDWPNVSMAKYYEVESIIGIVQ